MTLQLSIGGMVVPIQPIRSMSEAFFSPQADPPPKLARVIEHARVRGLLLV